MKKRFSKKTTKNLPKVAFGRTISTKSMKCLPSKIEESYESYFPEELRTGELIFSGICNLKVIRNLIKYYMEHEDLKRPEYLIKNGYFNQTNGNITHHRRPSTAPFYELVKK